MPWKRRAKTPGILAALLALLCAAGISSAALAMLGADPPVTSAAIPMPTIPPGGWHRGQIAVLALPAGMAPPKIDGSLDDPCWRTATHAHGFYRFNGTAPVLQQTEAWLCCDRKQLYVAFHCLDSEPDKIHTSETQRDGNIWHDDFVGVDIDSQNSRRNVSYFCVSERGTQVEHLDGGTADNITWAGDWHAATHRTPDGWITEIAIPFKLLRYSKGTKSFGILLYRQLARETSMECWPYIPPGGDQEEPQYLMDFTGMAPPTIAPRPVFLPYVLASGGEGSTVREGIDIKYPLTTTLTGVATINPDFQTVEQDVTNLAFSYTEKYLPDRRPFFAEGSDYLPYQDVFYSRRIGQIDGGLKVVGKDGATTVGLLGVSHGWANNWRGADDDPNRAGQNAYVVNLRRDLGLFSQMSVNVVEDQQQGQPSNQVGKWEGVYGFRTAKNSSLNVQYDYIPSWSDGHAMGTKQYASLNWNPPQGHVYGHVDYQGIPPDFVANLGYNPDLDFHGPSVNLGQYNHFDHGGSIEEYDIEVGGNSYQHWHGGFFQRSASISGYVGLRSGWTYSLSHTESARDTFRDHTTDHTIRWNSKSLFQRGRLSVSTGQQGGGAYRFVDLYQGFLVWKAFSMNTEASIVQAGTYRATQQIVTGTYRLNDSQTIGGRLVRQTGDDSAAAPGSQPPQGTDLFLSFGQHVRSGSDLFVLLGDPNSPATSGLITVKVLRPLQ